MQKNLGNNQSINRFSSRKFRILLLMSGVSTVLLWYEKLNSQEWTHFNKWLFGIYAAGNVSSKGIDAVHTGLQALNSLKSE